MMDAFRSEAIKAKEEFDWSFKPRKEWVFSRFTKLLLRLFFKEASADSVPTRKKLNKNRTNKRIVKESGSIKRSSSHSYFHSKNTRRKCEKIQSKREEYKGK